MRISLRELGNCVARSWLGHDASETAAALAFYCAFSLAPLLIIILAVAGRIVGENAAFGFVHAQLQMLFGGSMAGVVVDAMHHAQRPEGIWATIASVVTLVIGATTVFDSLEKALDQIEAGTLPRRGRPRGAPHSDRLITQSPLGSSRKPHDR